MICKNCKLNSSPPTCEFCDEEFSWVDISIHDNELKKEEQIKERAIRNAKVKRNYRL